MEVLVLWIVVGAILGALVGPRNGWTPGVSALIGATFSLLGVLFLLIVRAPEPSAESNRIADELEEYNAWQEGRQPGAPPASYVPCPNCATPIPMTARRCPSCR